MRKAAKQIALCAVALLLCCLACRFVFFDHLDVYIPLSEDGQEEPKVTFSELGIVDLGQREIRSGYLRVPVYPRKAGDADLMTDRNGWQLERALRVDRFRTVVDLNTGNYTGDILVLIAVTVFWFLVGAIMLWHFSRARGSAFYDYGTVYYAGFSLFALGSGMVMISVTTMHLIQPGQHSMYEAYSIISHASLRYMNMTAPLMLCFAGAMAVSNVALLRRERPRVQNALGLLAAAMLIGGELLGMYLFSQDFMGSETEYRVHETLLNTYATIFIYFQCMLTGAVICGVIAAKHKPAPDKDFIIVLGCWFRPDGSLPPLLRSRADRALAFWQNQKARTGKEARFIPSGGQGKNETMPEGEAIRQYLLSQGIEDRLILPEDQAVNTFQNMAFSGKIIRNTAPEGKTVFATSSYHVFRSGLWARQAGLSAEGIGSKTKWWFWPNAFMRETVGLLQKRWKQELLFLFLLIVFFGLLSMVL